MATKKLQAIAEIELKKAADKGAVTDVSIIRTDEGYQLHFKLDKDPVMKTLEKQRGGIRSYTSLERLANSLMKYGVTDFRVVMNS